MLYGYTLGKEKQGDFAMKVLFRQGNYTEPPVEEDFSRTTLAQDIEKPATTWKSHTRVLTMQRNPI